MSNIRTANKRAKRAITAQINHNKAAVQAPSEPVEPVKAAS